uniref:C2H2-type domain-containing protein n=1 Tax=Stomoxys calcitrans TaxID=35570 RepID=A0A1I8NMT2_STOCA
MTSSLRQCRLCLQSEGEFHELFDTNGRGNKWHDLTLEYFHPKIVDMAKAKHLRAICKECRFKMWDFHIFQETVRRRQIKLSRTQTQVSVKEGNADKEGGGDDDDDDVVFCGDDKEEDNTMDKKTLSLVIHSAEGDTQMVFEVSAFEATANKEVKSDIVQPDLEIDVQSDAEFISENEQEQHFGDIVNAALENRSDGDGDDDVIFVPQLDNETKDCGGDNNKIDELLATWIPNIQCVHCPVTYPTIKQLKKHFRLCHSDEEFYILCCGRKLKTRRHIGEHLMVHNDPEAFYCKKCGNPYTSSNSLRGHMLTKHTTRMKFKCKICGKSFQVSKGLEVHESLVHGKDMRIAPDIKTTADGKKLYGCRQCGNVYKTDIAFRSHRYNVHTREAKRKCKYCGRLFKSKYSHKIHEESHDDNGREQITCIVCGIKFQRKMPTNSRRWTMKNSSGHINKCRSCSRKANQNTSSQLAADGVVKSETKDSYACVYCPMTFGSKSLVMTHRRRKHPRKSNKNYYQEIKHEPTATISCVKYEKE